jgi:peptidoglycan hydrolase CwlO-like protein
LKNVDPTAYRCGLNDFVDSLDASETDEYKELQEEIEQLQSDIEDLESEIKDLENQIADLTE